VGALAKCPNLKNICDFEWSAILLQPANWGENPTITQQSHRTGGAAELDLHSCGLGVSKATVVLAGLLPLVSTKLKSLNIRYNNSLFPFPLPSAVLMGFDY
jgi:hypothetical protein